MSDRAVAAADASAAVERFLAALLARDSSEHTLRSYRTSLEAYTAWLEANGHDWRNPSRVAVRAFLADLSEGHGRRTVAQRLAALRSFYRYATRQGLVAGNPLVALATPRQRPRKATPPRAPPGPTWPAPSPSVTWQFSRPRTPRVFE